MGSCTSASRKNKNKVIVSNTLKNKNNNPTLNPDDKNEKNINNIPNSLSIIINENSENQNKTPVSIGQNTTFKELFTQLHININNDYDLELKENQIIKNFDVRNKIIETIYPYIKNNLNEVININLIYNGLQIPDNLIEAYIKNNIIIGSPIFDNPDYFAIILFNTQNNEIKSFYKEPKEPEYSLMNKFNSFTAYCNAKNHLYLSGGENDTTIDFDNSNKSNNTTEINDFFCIDLTTLNFNTNTDNNNNDSDPANLIDETNKENENPNRNILNQNENKNKMSIKQLPNLLEPRTWHSMLFVPDKYIFIVGGSTKSVEIYDLEKNTIIKDSTLNESRNECSLCMVNNIYLYAFCGFYLHQTFNTTVERCNLRKKERKWDFVKFNVKENLGFISSFFGVSYYKNDNIILIGGDSIEGINKSYLIKVAENENDFDDINEFYITDKKFGVFRDKFFTPINNNYSVNIPLVYGDNVQMLVLNMETGNIEQKIYNDLFNKEE